MVNSNLDNLKTASDCINTLFFNVRGTSTIQEISSVESVGINGSHCIVIYMSCLINSSKNSITLTDFAKNDRKYFQYVTEIIDSILHKYKIGAIRFTCLDKNNNPFYKDFIDVGNKWVQFGEGTRYIW